MCQQEYQAEVMDELRQAEEPIEGDLLPSVPVLFQMMVDLARRDVANLQAHAARIRENQHD